MRRLVICALALPLVAAVPSEAAPKRKPKPACAPLRDPSGDAGPLGSGNLDIVQGDVAVGPKEVVTVLRLAGNEAWAGERTAGAKWELRASANGVRVEVALRRGATGAQSSSVTVGGQAVPHTFTFGGSSLTWRWRRPAALAKPNLVWSDFAAATYTGPVGADTAQGSGKTRC